MARHRALALFLALAPALGLENGCGARTTADEVAAGHNLTGKVAIITGGDSGLGYAAAEALARQGAAVVLAGHSPAKCAAAARNLSAATGADVRGSPIDLANLTDVRAFAERVLRDFGGRVHLLVNDAGVNGNKAPDFKTADGFENTFQVNYLGHFLLTELLLPAMRQSRPARVVNVASEAHAQGCDSAGLGANCLSDPWKYLPPPVLTKHEPTPYGEHYDTWYGVTKLLLIEHAAELTRREAGNGVQASSLCPGLVDTNMTEHDPAVLHYCDDHPDFQHGVCPFSVSQGAAVMVYLALGRVPSPGGFYVREDYCKLGAVARSGFPEEDQAELYDRSLTWAGLASGAAAEAAIVTV